MTEQEKAHQLGEVLFEIKKHQDELRPLLVRAKRTGAALSRIGEQLATRPFGIESAEAANTPSSVGGGMFGADRNVFDYAIIEQLEREIGGHVRELHRLRNLRSQLEP